MPGPPDVGLVRELRRMVAAPKLWIAAGEMTWQDAGGKPPGFEFRQPLQIGDVVPTTLYVDGYYKYTTIPGATDKVSFTLCYRTHRIVGLDENGASRHYNLFGVGRAFHQQQVGHPHLHTVSDDAIYSYAEPIEAATIPEHWQRFLNEANITGAPAFVFPPAQLPLL